MEQQIKVENALSNAIRQLDKDLLRKAKADMFRCSAKCCDDPKMSVDENQACTEDCAKKIMRIQKLVQNEFINFQERLDRAAKSCEDDVRDQMTADSSDLQRAKVQRQYETCVSNHVDEHLLKLPKIIKKILVEGNKIQNS